MLDPFIGEIMLTAFNFPPRGWAICAGQLLPINQNQALFALLGTMYGGDGRVNFALPDLRGRAVIGFGAHTQGEKSGQEAVTLLTTHTGHQHPLAGVFDFAVQCYNGPGDSRTPVGSVPAADASNVTATYSDQPSDSAMRASSIEAQPMGTVGNAGGSQPHENRQPSLCLNYCIALQGIFPSQGF